MAKNILIVDDSSAMRSFIISSLVADGYSFIEAKSGFDALKELPRGGFSLVISDINMPDINGLELLNFIKTSDLYKHIPVIMISTETKEDDLKRAVSLGANSYVKKPFTADALKQEVDKIFGNV